MVLYIVIGIVILLILYILITYNSLVKSRNYVREAFSTMDVYLKKRWDLIPNLVEVVKAYAKHEQETLEGVISARNKAVSAENLNDKISADNEVTEAISKLFALTESYPDLKANTNFLNLQDELSKIETELAGARKYYNAAARNYNYATKVIPNCIVAKIFGHKDIKMFSADEEQKKNVKVEF